MDKWSGIQNNKNQPIRRAKGKKNKWKLFEKSLGYTAIPLLSIHSEKMKHSNLKRHMYPNVHSGTVYSSQDKEATQVSIIRQMDKEKVIAQRHTMDCYSPIKRKKFCQLYQGGWT